MTTFPDGRDTRERPGHLPPGGDLGGARAPQAPALGGGNPLASNGDADAGGHAQVLSDVINRLSSASVGERRAALEVVQRLLAASDTGDALALDITPETSNVLREAISTGVQPYHYSEDDFLEDRTRIVTMNVSVEGCYANVERLFSSAFPTAGNHQGGPLIKWVSYVLGVLPSEMFLNKDGGVARWFGEFHIEVEFATKVRSVEELPFGFPPAIFYEGGKKGAYKEFITTRGPDFTSFNLGHAHYQVANRAYWDCTDRTVPRTRFELFRSTHLLRGGLDAALLGQCGNATNEDDVKLTKAQKRANRKAAASLGAQGASMLARAVGLPQPAVMAASKLGEIGGAAAARLLGMGVVHVHNYNRPNLKHNSIIKGKMAANATYSQAYERVRGREQVALIKSNAVTGTNPVIYEFPIQPGLQNFARSLALTAMRYGEYCVEGLVFEFITETGDSPSSGVVGSVTFGYKANANISAPTDVDSMQMLDDPMDFKLSQSAGFAVECDPSVRLRPCLAVRTGNVTSGSLMDYDMGSMVLAIAPGSAGNDVELGKLYVTYDIRFMKKQLTTIRPGTIRLRRSGVASSTPTGTNGLLSIGSGSLAAIYASPGGTTIYFPTVAPGTVIRGKLLWYATSATGWTAGTPGFNDATGIAVYNANGASAYHFPLGGETCSKVALNFTVKVTAGINRTATLVMSGYTLPGAAVSFVEVEMDSEGQNLTLDLTL